MSKTYILGHLKPDTDAVVAALALADYYQQVAGQGSAQLEALPGVTASQAATEIVAAITEELNPETTFLFDKFGVSAPALLRAQDLADGDQVILVDHNEADQRLTGLPEEVIVGVVDHHKINLNLSQPIGLTFRPWGSSTTIVFHLMKQAGVTPDKTLAGLMLAAVLSDTVGYKSATTTEADRVYGTELAKLAEITDVDAFTLEIFKAKSDVSSLTIEQIIKNDYKVFDFGKKTFIDQLETVEQDRILTEKKTQLLEAMADVKAAEGVALLFVAITDILQVNTKLLILGDEEAAAATAAFGGTVTDHVLDIGPKMSRKKEIAPALEKALAQ